MRKQKSAEDNDYIYSDIRYHNQDLILALAADRDRAINGKCFFLNFLNFFEKSIDLQVT